MPSLYILDISPLTDVGLVNIFFQYVCCHFILLKVSFIWKKLFSFMRSHLSIVQIKPEPLMFYSGKFPLCSCVQGFFSLSLLLESAYRVLCVGLRSTWTWALNKDINLHCFTCRLPVRQAPFIENAIIFWLYRFGFFVKDQVTIGTWVYFWVFSFITLINLSVSVPIACGFYHYFSVVQLVVRDGKSQVFVVVDDCFF